VPRHLLQRSLGLQPSPNPVAANNPVSATPQVADRSHESGDAAEAQEYLVKLPDRIRKLAERTAARRTKAKPLEASFSWIFDRPLTI
jgi:hypothetical protein